MYCPLHDSLNIRIINDRDCNEKKNPLKADAEAALRNRDVTDVNIRLFHHFLAARDLRSHQDELDLLIDSISVTAFSF